jgi:uncharacterized protein
MEYLPVDSYKVINVWKDILMSLASLGKTAGQARRYDVELSGTEKERDYYRVRHLSDKGKSGKGVFVDNIKIAYTKENETADNYIERFVYRVGIYRNRKLSIDIN